MFPGSILTIQYWILESGLIQSFENTSLLCLIQRYADSDHEVQVPNRIIGGV